MNGRDEIDYRESEGESQDQSRRVIESASRFGLGQGKRFEGGEGARDEEQGVHSGIAYSDFSRPGGKEGAGELLIMAREMFEFYCEGGCKGFTVVPVDIEFDCDVIMVCPSCKHEHYRTVKDGKITSLRHATTKDDSKVHRLEPTLAAFSKTKQLKEQTKDDPKGFLSGLWDRKKI
jgi:hypothetical protein